MFYQCVWHLAGRTVILTALVATAQVVVPVRETAAQALAAVIQPVDVNSLKCILNILQALKRHDNWHVRHGAFTGIKYVLASRPEAAEELLPLTLPALLEGLQDSNDDIQAAAAQALVPMAPAVMQLGTQVSAWITNRHFLPLLSQPSQPHLQQYVTQAMTVITYKKTQRGMQLLGRADCGIAVIPAVFKRSCTIVPDLTL